MMDLAEAYRVLGLAPGSGQALVQAAHQQAYATWAPYRQHPDVATRQRTEAELARFDLAAQIIAAAGFPGAAQQPPQYGALPGQGYPPPPPPYVQGYPQQQPFVIPHAHSSSRAGGMIAGGIGLILLGAIVTSATLEHAQQEGGTYFIAYGPIILGVILLFQGIIALGRKK